MKFRIQNYELRIVCIGLTCGAGFAFVFYGKGVGVGTRGRSAGEWGDLRGLLQIQA